MNHSAEVTVDTTTSTTPQPIIAPIPIIQPPLRDRLIEAIKSGKEKEALEILCEAKQQQQKEEIINPLEDCGNGTLLIAKAMERTPTVAATIIKTVPKDKIIEPMMLLNSINESETSETLLRRSIQIGAHCVSEALMQRCIQENKEELIPSADSLCSPSTTWLELAVDHRAMSVVTLFASLKSFAPMSRVSDGRTLLEIIVLTLGKLLNEQQKEIISKSCNQIPLSCLSDGRTVFEILLTIDSVIPLLQSNGGILTGTERLPDGTTIFERTLEKHCVSAALIMASSENGIDPHGCASTGVSFFERALNCGEAEVAGKLASRQNFDPLERIHDGRTLLELVLMSNAKGSKGVAVVILAGGKVPARALLSDGRTAFSKVLKDNAKELIYASFAGQGLSALTKLPPDEKSCFEMCCSCPPNSAGVELAFVMARFAGLDGLAILSDGKTCFERALLDNRQNIAVAMVDAGSITPNSRLPDGRTCLDFAASVSARDVCQALAKRV